MHLFEMHCSFLPLFNRILTFNRRNLAIICCTTEQARGMGFFLVCLHKLLCMHVYEDFLRCKSVCDVTPRIDLCPFLARSCNRWWLDFVAFAVYKKDKISLKRRRAFWIGAKIYWSEKRKILELGTLCYQLWTRPSRLSTSFLSARVISGHFN